jgi:hypothetical protein
VAHIGGESNENAKLDRARELLAQVPALQHPCDLDLFMFFAKHPRTLIASEQLARMLGYQLKEIARSLDILLAAGMLARTQHPSRLARMYVFAKVDTDERWLRELVELASSREGRLTLRRALTHVRAGDAISASPHDDDAAPAPSGVRPFRVRPKPEIVRRSSANQERRGRDG